MSLCTLAEKFKIVNGNLVAGIVAGNAVSTGDYVCLKNIHRATAVIMHSGANDTDLTLEFSEAQDVAGTGAQDVTATSRIWTNGTGGTAADALTRQTDAATHAIDPATEDPAIVVMEFDPAKFSVGFDCIAIKGNNGHSSNNVSVMWYLETAMPADPPPTAITD